MAAFVAAVGTIFECSRPTSTGIEHFILAALALPDGFVRNTFEPIGASGKQNGMDLAALDRAAQAEIEADCTR